VPEDGVAADEDHREPEWPRDTSGIELEEPEPLAEDHDEEDRAEDDAEERQDMARKAPERVGVLRGLARRVPSSAQQVFSIFGAGGLRLASAAGLLGRSG
jgi:hypothetical protein